MRTLVAGAAAAVLVMVGLPAVVSPAVGVADCDHAWPGGDGSVANPYRVATAADLQAIDTCLDKSFVQTADISLAGQDWDPIGGLYLPFTGSYDGAGHAVTGLAISVSDEVSASIGLFAELGTPEVSSAVASASVRDLRITGASITVSGELDAYQIGTLAGMVRPGATVSGVRATGSGAGRGIEVDGYVSGVGGLVGVVVGPATVERSSADVDVIATGEDASGIGGLVGVLAGGSGAAQVAQSRATGSVRTAGATSSVATGGLIGVAGVRPKAEFETGSVKLRDSYATGSVAGRSAVGGLVGVQLASPPPGVSAGTATIVNSYATGPVSGEVVEQVGGLVGNRMVLDTLSSGGAVTSGYWDTATSGVAAGSCSDAAACGAGRTTPELQTRSTFVGWSFADVKTAEAVWGICDVGPKGYPFLWAFTDTSPCWTVPGAPLSPSAVAGDGQATVTWSPPAADGGTPVTGYVAEGEPLLTGASVRYAGPTCTTTGALSCTVTGLTNGTPYVFTVRATNLVGTGAESVATAAVTPVAVTVRQKPARPLGLPRKVRNAGWTTVVSLPVETNAGQDARVRVTCLPRGRALVPAGDVAYCRVVRRNGTVRVWLSGTRASVVRVVISAPAVPGYTAYRKVVTYRTTAVR